MTTGVEPGKAVEQLRERKIEAFGCDVFYEGGKYSESVRPEPRGGVIRRMEKAMIPFDSDYFDFVTNNQVIQPRGGFWIACSRNTECSS